MKLAGIQSLYDSNFKFVHESHKDEGLNEYESFPKGGKLKKHMHIIHEKHKDHRCESCGELFSKTIYRVHKCEKPHWNHKLKVFMKRKDITNMKNVTKSLL